MIITSIFPYNNLEVNYHQLMSGDDPLSVLLPALGDHNIHPIAKLAKSIPLKVSTYVILCMLICTSCRTKVV